MFSIPGHVWLTSANQVNLSILSVMSMGKDKLIQTIILEQNPSFSYFYLSLGTLCVHPPFTAHIMGGHLNLEKCLL